MEPLRCLLLVSSVPLFLAAPATDAPFWFNPCGVVPVDPDPFVLEQLTGGESVVEEITLEEQISTSLYTVRKSLENSRGTLQHMEFDELYKDVKRGVQDEQYIPNWLPSRETAKALLTPGSFTHKEVADKLPLLLKDLQKFAVALEQVFNDEDNTYPHTRKVPALQLLVGQHKQMLCEVETALWSLDRQSQPPVGRSIMVPEERQISDSTHRLIRDNGVLVKYRDYLAAWDAPLALTLLS